MILKPDPGSSQELYLGSLEALGIDTRANDIRFVQDNWEAPVLGAWGLGWEVWLNGQEITQVLPLLKPAVMRCCLSHGLNNFGHSVHTSRAQAAETLHQPASSDVLLQKIHC